MKSGPKPVKRQEPKRESAPETLSPVRDCIVLVTRENNLCIDRSFLTLFGYGEPGEVINKPFASLVHHDDRERVLTLIREHEAEGILSRHHEFRGVRKDGSIMHVELCVTLARWNDEPLSLIYLRDVTTKKRWEENLRASEEKYRTLFENSMDAIYISTKDGKFVDVNEAFLSLFGYTRDQARSLNALDGFTPKDRERLRSALRRTGFVRDFELTLHKKDGRVMECLLTVNRMAGESGKTAGYQGIVRDVTAYKKAREALQYMAYHDSLTGLPNRILFRDRLNMAVINAARNRQRIAIMVLDLDRFKNVNDVLGHDTGDKLLKAVADRLAETVRKSDTVARMGGDEFLLIIPELNTVNDALFVSEKITESFRKAFPVDHTSLSITCSIGIAVYPDHGTDGEELIRAADMAMYRVKDGGRDGCLLYGCGAPEEGFSQ